MLYIAEIAFRRINNTSLQIKNLILLFYTFYSYMQANFRTKDYFHKSV